MPYTYDYPRPSVTVDAVVFGYDGTDMKVLLIQRKNEPFENCWALPGGFVDMEEDLETAVKRELEEETGLKDIFFEQLYTFGAPNRDPRGRVISIAYFALVKKTDFFYAKAASDAKDLKWFSMSNLTQLAFDHNEILSMAMDRIRGKVRWQPIGFELLPTKFPLSELQHIYETILGGKLDKRNFRKNILKMDILMELDEFQQDVSHRAARLYSFDQEKYEKKLKEGFDFELRQKLLKNY